MSSPTVGREVWCPSLGVGSASDGDGVLLSTCNRSSESGGKEIKSGSVRENPPVIGSQTGPFSSSPFPGRRSTRLPRSTTHRVRKAGSFGVWSF